MIGVGMIALAMAATYSAWCWRAEKRAARAHEIANLARSDETLKRATSLMERLLHIRQAAVDTQAPPFPTEGDNFTTLPKSDVVVEFGKRPKPEGGGDSVA